MTKLKTPPSMKPIPSSVKRSNEVSMDTEDPRPTLRFTEDQLPELKKWEVGRKYNVMLEVEQISTEKKEYGSDKGKICATFKVSSVGPYEK